jgi:hypothetical protein
MLRKLTVIGILFILCLSSVPVIFAEGKTQKKANVPSTISEDDMPPSDTNVSDKLKELIITLQQYQESLSGYQDELDKLEMLLEDNDIEDKGTLKAISKMKHCLEKQESKIGCIIEKYIAIHGIITDIEETVTGIVDAARAAFDQTLDEAQQLVDELVETASKTAEDAVSMVDELVQTLIDGEIPFPEPGAKPHKILKEDFKRLKNDTKQFKTELHDPLIQLKLIILLINESDQNEKD